ncbi:hypothetical protein IT157_09540 [bacterium]|nr:hypothetical protein [bacterium]
MNFGEVRKQLLAVCLPVLLLVTGFEALAHDCDHPESHEDCALCAVSHTPAENSTPQTVDPPECLELVIAAEDFSAPVSTLPRAHFPRSPPTL